MKRRREGRKKGSVPNEEKEGGKGRGERGRG